MILFQMYVLSLLPQTQRLLTSMMHLCCRNSLHSVSLLKQAWLKNGTAFRSVNCGLVLGRLIHV